jgi:thioredoxin 1
MSTLQLPIITSIPTLEYFQELMENNPGLIVIKLGAPWCGPCQVIEPDVNELFAAMPSNVQCLSINIDDNVEFYSFLKKKRVVNGVPAIICYKRGNTSNVPNDYAIGANRDRIADLRKRCLEAAVQIAHQ